MTRAQNDRFPGTDVLVRDSRKARVYFNQRQFMCRGQIYEKNLGNYPHAFERQSSGAACQRSKQRKHVPLLSCEKQLAETITVIRMRRQNLRMLLGCMFTCCPGSMLFSSTFNKRTPHVPDLLVRVLTGMVCPWVVTRGWPMSSRTTPHNPCAIRSGAPYPAQRSGSLQSGKSDETTDKAGKGRLTGEYGSRKGQIMM